MRHLVFVFTLLVAIPTLLSADVYKWTDENGQVHFGDRPSHKNAKNLNAPGAPVSPRKQATPLTRVPNTVTSQSVNKNRAAVNASVNQKQFEQELNRLAMQPSLKDLITKINSTKSPLELKITLDWLQKRFMSVEGGSRFSYLYAINLYKLGKLSPAMAGMKDSASMALVAGMLRSRVDANWCKDKTAPGHNISQWETQLRPILNHYSGMGSAKKNKITNFAVQSEARSSRRGPDAWICANGMAYFTKFFEKHKDNPNPPITKVDRPDQIGQSRVLHDKDIQPEFVSRSVWLNKRDTTVSKFVKWIKEYNP